MNSLKADGSGESNPSDWGLEELQVLASLGFGPDSALMTEPKIFVDAAFLAALQQELSSELGSDEAELTLFHIGMIHGLRDAARIGGADPEQDGHFEVIEYPPLAMRFGPSRPANGDSDESVASDSFEMTGNWPDHFEAEARLSKLGAASQPACPLSAGYTSGWLSGTLDRDVIVRELKCRAAGHESCLFVARDELAIDADSERPTRRRLPVASVRAIANGNASAASGLPADISRVHTPPLTEEIAVRVDPDDPAVHIWGPVLVMPFTGPEAAIQTIETLTLDEATRTVRVVVLDLFGAVLDQSFGTAALERVVEQVQSWGAEVILTGISPLSEEVVTELQASLMLSRKDLPEAIAYAFQIADAQRHLL
jgi:anti-anti-sigma regulatory factor